MKTDLVVGRDDELAAADRFLDDVPEGVRALVLEGEPGIGKTTLWREVVGRADARGFRILAARPAQAEARLSFSSLADLLGGVSDDELSALPPPQRFALEAALLRSDAGGSGPAERAVGAGVLSLLREAAAEQALLVAVDDAQWLDRPTAWVLEFVLRRLRAEPVGIVASVRAIDGTAPRTFERAIDLTLVERAAIGPLSVAGLHVILKLQLGRSFPRPTLVRIDRACGGNPFYALEIARELAREASAPVGELPVPADVRELVKRRVRRLPAATRDALLMAAALSRPTTLLVDDDALAPAEAAGIVRVEADRVVFAHPLYASAVYASAPAARRRRLHATLATMVADPEERGRHLALAATEPDESVAQALEHAAARARSRGAWESGAELLEAARNLTPTDTPEEAQRRGLDAAEHHVHAGDRPRARALLDQLLAQPLPRAQRANALRVLAEISSDDENFAEAMSVYDEALEYADDPVMVVAIEAGLAYVCAGSWEFAKGIAHAARALAAAEASGNDRLLSVPLALCTMLDFLLGRGIDWDKLERALALEDHDTVMPLQGRPSMLAALLYLYAGEHAEARSRLSAAWARAAESGDESDVAFVLIWLGWLETRSGNLARAAELSEEAALHATLTGSTSMRAWALAQRAFVHAHRGEIEEARRACGEAAALRDDVNFFLEGLWIAASLALLELSLGNPEAAWQECVPLTEPLEAHGFGEPIPVFFLPDALEALIALGQLERAEALLDLLEARGRDLDRGWALATGGRCRGLLLAARGEVAGAEEALVRALTEHERLELPFERARTLLCLGTVQRRRKRRKMSRDTLGRALELFEEIGMPLWADRARVETARLGIRRAPTELTEGETRVAELAASGLTNREIAAQLFISRRTVEANLARAYRKLDIRSRAELGVTMARRG